MTAFPGAPLFNTDLFYRPICATLFWGNQKKRRIYRTGKSKKADLALRLG
jgi:hypothetical protein